MGTKRSKRRADRAYEGFLKALKWALIAFAAYICLNVAWKLAWNHFHLDGSLWMKDGRVVADEGALIRNFGTASAPRYFAYATVKPVEGYALLDDTLMSDGNETDFLFQPVSAAKADQLYVAVTAKDYQAAAREARERIARYYEGAEATDIVSRTANGRNAVAFTYSYPKEGGVLRGCNLYLDTGDHAVLIALTSAGDIDLASELERVLPSVEPCR